ncbi:MAG TPA: MG2 domain-containing protein, partial [Gemmataceae bacterium]|nr:MG2 domain-containing protein [Gemmataceae bacterium]
MMLTPEQFQEQVLPYLYDVLDEEERHAFEAALDASAEARACLEGARLKQALLAEAVKMEFPGVTFARPPAPTKVPPPIAAPPRRTRARGRRLPWAVAATILVIALGGGGFWSVASWMNLKQQLAHAEAKFDQANDAVRRLAGDMQSEKLRATEEVRALREQETRLFQDWTKAAQDQDKLFSEKEVQVFIKSPRALQAGASNSIQIEMKHNEKKPAPAGMDATELNARVVDQAGKRVLYDKILDTKNGQTKFNLDLPRDLPVKPEMDLALEVFAKNAGNAPVDLREQLTLTAPEYVTHLFTDRPMYRPGETVHYRSLTLDRFTLKPAQEDLRLRFRITDPNQGEVPGSQIEGTALLTHDPKEPPLSGPDGQPLRGIGTGEFRIPDGLAGGQYTLHVAEAGNRFPAVQRKFIIHQWQAPRLNKEITFDRASYGPGDVVNISALCTPVEGAGQGAPLEATGRVVVDGKPWELQRLRVAPDGRIRFSYTLPPVAEMPGGNGIVSLTYFDGGTQETVVRPIPIVLNKMFVDFYPEGGDLISGLSNRVYFQARTST